MMPTFPRSPLSFRTAGFPQYGWKAGFPSGAFLDDQRFKPAPGMRRPTSSLHPPFVRLVVSTVVPLCVGSPTRLRTAVEGHYSSAPGALAQVRVIVSRTVITYSAPSVPLAGTSRFHRMAAMSQTLNAAIAVVGIDIGKNSFHVVGHDERGAIVLRQKWSRGQVEARFANIRYQAPHAQAERIVLSRDDRAKRRSVI